MIRALIIFLIVALPANMLAQDEMSAKEHIQRLNKGILLVRLETKGPTIKAMRDRGMVIKADQTQQKVDDKNLELVAAFDASYTFSKVRFFYSTDTEKILASKFSEVTILDENLNPTDEKLSNDGVYYTAKLGSINTDASYEGKSPTGPSRGSDMRFQALVIMDTQFRGLQRPFPYYSRTFNSFFIRRDVKVVVEILNERLIDFLNK